ncbi:hypothetical protein BJ993_004163 [Nocardioides aromaticivorans]|uniref:WD40 repeat domain-containing protein n=1 Tax=Nocardioides aromaticivorans TaxID=200618 RepID=A0A7Z0CQ90_9ACTN|nr:hypothetical protein [Nocardioides aromaticivorans]NYI47083.1 hypothetical protein [Nocardioides aromaticivorans]
MSTLHDQLADLADAAPTGGPVPGLWQQGVRRQRRRRNARLGAVAAAVVVVAALAGLLRTTAPEEPEPVQVPFGELHLPRMVYPPDPWAESTTTPGPLAAIGTASKFEPTGIRGHVESFAAFGVSAVDGSAVFLDLPWTGEDGFGPGGPVLSPDGTKVAWVRYTGGTEPVVNGFAVLDTMTGRARRLSDPDNPVIKGMDVSGLTFSGDSRYLEVSYSLTGSDADRAHSLVLWDVATGARRVAEPAGRYWLPNMGSAPAGTVWSRGDRTFTFDPVTGRTTSERSGFKVVQASYGPERSFAAIAFGETDQADWRLFVGASPRDVRQVRLDMVPEQLLGWRDATHVVIRDLPTGRAVEVDLATLVSTDLRLDVSEDLFDLPSYAADLWANPLVDGVRPPDASDPRTPWWFAGPGIALLAAAAFVTWWRRRV